MVAAERSNPVADNNTNALGTVVFEIVGTTDGTSLENKQQGAGDDTEEK